MIAKTQGIALRIRPWSRTSHVVTWLTPDHGRVVTSVKGACRPKSAFLGQYDVAYTCELLFYRRDHDGLHAIRECTPIALREPLRDNWRAAATASYLCDLAARAAWPQEDAGEHYQLLTSALDQLCSSAPHPGQVFAHEIALLGHLGLMPDLTRCPTCHTPSTLWLRFSVSAGRLLCAHVRPEAASDQAVTLHRDVLDTLALWTAPAGAQPDRAWHTAKLPPHLALGIRRFLGMFMRYHLDITPSSRRVLFELLEAEPNRWTEAPKGKP
jgi:DNA repair protein RecO (recombination protein O)